MSQPMNMKCQIEAKGDIDRQSGEFWVENPFDMLNGEHNFSAFESNRFMLNRKDGPFVDLSHESTADIDSDSRSAIAADFDRDGDLDLLVASVGGGALRLFRNEIPSDAHRVRIALHTTKGKRDAVGAQVRAKLNNSTLTRDVFPTNGFMGQAPAELLLGVGSETEIDRLEIRWADGKIESFENVPVDGTVSITQGTGEFRFAKGSWTPTEL